MNSFCLVKITGKDVKRFTMSLYKQGFRFYSMEYHPKTCLIKISYQDYLKLKKMKTIYEIERIQIYGWMKIRSFFHQYRLFFCSLLLGLIFLSFLSHIIFDVEVINEKKEIRDFVMAELKKKGIEKYHFVKGFYKNEEITEEILKENRDLLEWMEIEKIGTKYVVKVEQRKINNTEEDTTPRDIIAKKKGIILSIEAENGEVLKKVNQYVNVGDTLITGIIKNKDTIKDVIHATGTVYAETWYHVTVTLPLTYQETEVTNEMNHTILFSFLNNKITSSNYQYSNSTSILEYKDPLLPIQYGIYKEQKIEKKEFLYTSERAILDGMEIGRDHLLRTLGKEDKIIYEKCLKITENDSKIELDIFFKAKENITDYKTIDLESLREENKKEE